jgi:nanoRNase/pAp phosphatase (c-di-AMP/oligoRNAs hydrolase)
LNNELVARSGRPYSHQALNIALHYEIIYQLLKMDQGFESTISQANREHPSTALVRSIIAARHPQGTNYSTAKLARFLYTFKDSLKEAVHMLSNLQDVNNVSIAISQIRYCLLTITRKLSHTSM